jgi:threonyl-tRNA synthetase
MIHRALMGSLERFIGCLVEHYAGAFPVWLAPVQAIVLTVTDRGDDFSKEVAAKLKEAGLRVEVDNRNEKLGYKIREAQLNKIPYMLVVGDREVEDKTVSPRLRGEGNLDPMSVDKLIEVMQEENRPLGGDPS